MELACREPDVNRAAELAETPQRAHKSQKEFWCSSQEQWNVIKDLKKRTRHSPVFILVRSLRQTNSTGIE